MSYLKVFILIFAFLVIYSKAEDAANGLLVRLKSSVKDADLEIFQSETLNIRTRLQIGNRLLLTIENNSPDALASLSNNPMVELVEPNYKVSMIKPVYSDTSSSPHRQTEPIDSPNSVGAATCQEQPVIENNENWGLIRTSHRELPSYSTDNYRYHYTGLGVDVYIMDSGIDVDHVEFEGRASHGFVASSLRNTEGERDLDGHGTYVASLAGGKDYGIAKGSNLVSVKVMGVDGGYNSDVVEGIYYIVDRVNMERAQGKRPRVVINMSFGSSVYSQILYDAFEGAIHEGLTFVAAAGNTGSDFEHYPAAYDNVISVGATDISDWRAGFSNYGPTVDIFAPGEDVVGGYSRYSEQLECSGFPLNGCLIIASGTSVSSPHVAGVVARYLEQLTLSELLNVYFEGIKEMLIETSTKDQLVLFVANPSTTSNRLLYKNCGRTDFTLPEPCWNCRGSGGFPGGDSGVSQITSTWVIILIECLALANYLI